MVLKKLFLLQILIFSLLAFTATAQVQSISVDSLIQQTIRHKSKNNPSNYEYTAYHKLIITANPHLIEGNIDSVFVLKRRKKVLSKLDSSDYVFKKIITKQHLYVTEKISKFRYADHASKETILATRMAGFKEPIFEYFSLQLQPFSLYDDVFSLIEKKYTSPLSKRGVKKYNFSLIETTTINNRNVYKVSFYPKQKTRTDNLEGILFLDVEKLSIAKAELKIDGVVRVKLNHDYDYNSDFNNWFPSKNSLVIRKGNSKIPIKIFGETITFEGTNQKLNPKGKKYASDFIEITSNSTYFEPRINQGTKFKHHDIALEIDDNAISKKDNLWYTYFNDSTDVRSTPTYISLDSLAEKRRIENKLRIGRKIIKGYYPVGFFDIDLRYLLRFNNYEGFRVGFGGITNDKLSKNFKVEGYYVYGTKDGIFKGFISNTFKINKKSETWVGFSYKDDVIEIANDRLEIDKRTFKIYDPRPFNISTFYNHETWRGFVETKFIPKTESIWQISQSFIEPKFNYQYHYKNESFTDFRATIFTTSVQWNPFSKYMQTPNGKIETEKKFPKFTFQFSKTLPKVWQNNFDFGKVDFRFDYQKKFNSNHKLLFLFEGGYAFGAIPITHVYNHSPNNLTKDKILQRVTFAGKDSFETMYFNEFFSNKHAFFQLEHQFPKWIISRKIKPVFLLSTRYAIGSLENKVRHQNIEFKTLEKGYLESGFELNNIYNYIGFVAFYRYGPNHLPNFEDNIAIKLSIKIDLGLN